MLERKKGSRITDEFLEAFGRLYHSFKYFGITPSEICLVFTTLLNVSKSSYLTYLKRAREKGFVVDSYEDNREALKKRIKGECQEADPEVKALIFSYIGNVSKKTTRKRKVKTK